MLLRDRHAEHAEVGEGGQQIGRVGVGPLPLGDRRDDVSIDELTHHVAQRALVGGETGRFAHQCTVAPGVTGSRLRPHRQAAMSISGSRPASNWLTIFPVIGPAALPKM